MFPNGTIAASSGPGDDKIYFFDYGGNEIQAIAGDTLEGSSSFVGFQFLTEHSWIVTNWPGHSPTSSNQIFEYDSAGHVVWSYYQEESSLVETIILDNLDIRYLHNEKNGVLAPDTVGATCIRALSAASRRPSLRPGGAPVCRGELSCTVTGGRVGMRLPPGALNGGTAVQYALVHTGHEHIL